MTTAAVTFIVLVACAGEQPESASSSTTDAVEGPAAGVESAAATTDGVPVGKTNAVAPSKAAERRRETVIFERFPEPSASRPVALPVVTTAAEQLLPLVGTRVNARVVVDGLAKTIAVTGVDGRATARAIGAKRDAPCVPSDVRDDALTLICTTSRISAAIVRKAARDERVADEKPRPRTSMLRVRVTLGPPPGDGATTFPRMLYPPETIEIGGPCPGDTTASRAECALFAGDLSSANALLLEARKDIHRPYAELRLGDLAFERGDLQEAAAHWALAGRRGPFGRLAVQRRCELSGTCREVGRYAPEYDALDTVALGVFTDEMLLRKARILAFDGELDAALDVLVTHSTVSGEAHACRLALLFCQRVVKHGLESENSTTRARGFAVFTTLPLTPRTALRVPVTQQAAMIADEVGAPGYGAALLASVAGEVDKALLVDHLQRTAELYVRARDYARARLVLEFALGMRGDAASRAAQDALLSRVDAGEREADVAIERDVTNDGQVLGDQEELRARAVLDKARARGGVARSTP
jgi:tetratricopeptide (TPR) repeat protein